MIKRKEVEECRKWGLRTKNKQLFQHFVLVVALEEELWRRSILLIRQKPLMCGWQQTVENSYRDRNTRPPYLSPISWETCMRVKKEQNFTRSNWLTQNWKKKLGKEYHRAVYCHSIYLTSMQSTSCKMLWMNPIHESQTGIKIARRNINNIRHADDTMQKMKN